MIISNEQIFIDLKQFDLSTSTLINTFATPTLPNMLKKSTTQGCERLIQACLYHSNKHTI